MDVTSQSCSHTVCIFLSRYGVNSRLGCAASCQGRQIHLINTFLWSFMWDSSPSIVSVNKSKGRKELEPLCSKNSVFMEVHQ